MATAQEIMHTGLTCVGEHVSLAKTICAAQVITSH